MSEQILEPEKKVSVFELLQKQFPAKEYALMAEISNKAGYDRSRSADYIVMSLWPSRGLTLTTIEVKAYRGDWIKEKQNPEKAEAFYDHSDYFYLLTENENVARLEEIPETWGWICVVGKKLVYKKYAPRLNPKPIDKSFLAALLKRASCKDKYVHIDSIQDKINQLVESKIGSLKNQVEHWESNYQELNKKVRDFESKAGITITRNWGHDPKKVGEAVKIVLNGGVDEYIKRLNGLKNVSQKINNNILHDIETLNKISSELINSEVKQDM